MDNVRFGRALGKGARAAATSLWEAAEAAAAQPSAATAKPAATTPAAPRRPPAPAAGPAWDRAASPARSAGAARSSSRPSLLAPLRRFSGVLWLEVTGTFFALFAAFMVEGAWKLRAAAHLAAGSPDGRRLWMHVAVFVLFGYFAVSSFVRARRRERG